LAGLRGGGGAKRGHSESAERQGEQLKTRAERKRGTGGTEENEVKENVKKVPDQVPSGEGIWGEKGGRRVSLAMGEGTINKNRGGERPLANRKRQGNLLRVGERGNWSMSFGEQTMGAKKGQRNNNVPARKPNRKKKNSQKKSD